jgi:hypothetical protein
MCAGYRHQCCRELEELSPLLFRIFSDVSEKELRIRRLCSPGFRACVAIPKIKRCLRAEQEHRRSIVKILSAAKQSSYDLPAFFPPNEGLAC